MKELWIELEKSMPLRIKEALIEVAKKRCNVILSDKTDVPLVKAHGIRVASQESGDILIIDESKIDFSESVSQPRCLRIIVKDKNDEEKVIKAAKKGFNYIAIDCPDWKIIPLENLIAKIQDNTKLLAEISNAEEAKVALETLELGVKGVILKTEDINEVKSTISAINNHDRSNKNEQKIKLVSTKITRHRKLSMGARVCIDTCDIMMPGEGILLGCSSSGLFLVQAEVEENPYVDSRPFRVNAGPVSLYVLVPGNKTRYLSELKAGEEVLIADREGRTRNAIIGRIKIERRPMMLVETEIDGDQVKIIVQNAETIRFVTRDGSISVAELKQGDEVLICHQHGGRHFGTLVEKETIIER